MPASPASRRTWTKTTRADRGQPPMGIGPTAALLQQLFGIDALACPTCHGAMRIVAFITHSSVIDQILTHLRTRAAPAAHPGARSPPSTRARASQGASRAPCPPAGARGAGAAEPGAGGGGISGLGVRGRLGRWGVGGSGSRVNGRRRGGDGHAQTQGQPDGASGGGMTWSGSCRRRAWPRRLTNRGIARLPRLRSASDPLPASPCRVSPCDPAPCSPSPCLSPPSPARAGANRSPRRRSIHSPRRRSIHRPSRPWTRRS